MKNLILILFAFFSTINTFAQDKDLDELMKQDWPNLKKYREANKEIAEKETEIPVVFMGNSITEGWVNTHPDFFKDNHYAGRGISGQTTPQMLIRFMPDVVDLHPKAVVILAGTNDIAGNTGFSSVKMIEDNLQAMAQLARANNIKVILCSILPAAEYPWRKSIKSIDKIAEVNAWIKEFAAKNNYTYVDFFSEMVNDQNGMKADLTLDGVHPNSEGYSVMEPIIKSAIEKTLQN